MGDSSNYGERVIGRRDYGVTTANAGTAFALMIEPWHKGGWTRLTGVRYRTGATAHTLYLLRVMGKTYFSAAAAASQAVVSLTADPGLWNGATIRTATDAIASGDYCVYRAADGTYVMDTAAGSYSSGQVTMSTNLPTGGVLSGDPFWYLGIFSDTNPNNAQAHPSWNCLANSTTILDRSDALTTINDALGNKCGGGQGQPLILYSANGTNQGFLESVGVEYVRKAVA